MSLGDLLAKTQKNIETIGWQVIGVFPTEDDPGLPFSYSIGFYEHEDHPEMIVLGLNPKVAHSILGTFYERIAAGERFSDGDVVSEILDGYDVRLCALPADGRPLNMARQYYGTDELPALQIIWPDIEGRFPGEEGFDTKFEAAQDLGAVR